MKTTLCISYLLAFILAFSAFSYSQNVADALLLPDSLVGKLKEFRKADYQRAEALDACIEFFYEEEKIEDAAPYINELEQLANELNDRYWLAKSDYYQGLYAYASSDVEKAFMRFGQAQRTAETMQENEFSQTLLARIFLAKSAAYMSVDLLTEAYESIEKGLNIVDQYDLRKFRNRLINNKASLSYSLGHFEESLSLMKTLHGETMDSKWLKNIADLYCELGSCDSALILIDSVFATLQAGEKKADVLLTKSFILNRLENWEESELCLDEAREMLCSDSPLWTLLYMRLAEVHIGENRFQDALQEINAALATENSNIKNVGLECACLQKKTYILRNLGDYQAALECQDSFLSLYDTVLNKSNQKLEALRFQHDSDRMKQQFESEQALLHLRQTFIFIIAGILVLFSGLFAIIVWKSKKRREEMLKLELDYRNREITSKALNQNQGNETLNEVIQELTHFLNNPKGNENVLPSAIRRLKGLVDDGSKSEFDYYFVEVHPDFYTNLKKDFPDLTPNELRLCAFAKLNLPLKKIAEINNVSIDSVKSSRKRLRKSLNIDDPKIDLADFLSKY